MRAGYGREVCCIYVIYVEAQVTASHAQPKSESAYPLFSDPNSHFVTSPKPMLHRINITEYSADGQRLCLVSLVPVLSHEWFVGASPCPRQLNGQLAPT